MDTARIVGAARMRQVSYARQNNLNRDLSLLGNWSSDCAV